MQLIPYLNYDGTCEEAFRFYEKVLGGNLELMKAEDAPISEEMGDAWKDRVLHARLSTGDAALMGSDTPPGEGVEPRGIHVSIHVDDPEEAERIFQGLGEGGTVTMGLEKTFWARRFGMLVDRWGIPWMINCE